MKTMYQCEICNQFYATKSKAIECEASTEVPRFKVGDIVVARGGYGWFDGDSRWIQNFKELGMYTSPGIMPGKLHKYHCFCHHCTYVFYYVITYIGNKPTDPHIVAYSLFTKAMKLDNGYSQGWTTHNDSHYNPRLVKRPPAFIVRDSKDLLGVESDRLL